MHYGEGLAAIIVEPVAGEHGRRPAGAGYLETLRRLCDASGALLDLRRGDHRLPRRARRRAGAVRRHARPDGARQDRRRRAAARGVRRPRGDHGSARAGRPRLPGRHARRATRSRRRRGSRCCAGCATAPSTTSSSASAARLEEGLAPFGRVQRVGALLTLFMTDGAGAQLRGRAGVRHRALRRALPPPARAGRLLPAVAVRGALPLDAPTATRTIERTIAAVATFAA